MAIRERWKREGRCRDCGAPVDRQRLSGRVKAACAAPCPVDCPSRRRAAHRGSAGAFHAVRGARHERVDRGRGARGARHERVVKPLVATGRSAASAIANSYRARPIHRLPGEERGRASRGVLERLALRGTEPRSGGRARARSTIASWRPADARASRGSGAPAVVRLRSLAAPLAPPPLRCS